MKFKILLFFYLTTHFISFANNPKTDNGFKLTIEASSESGGMVYLAKYFEYEIFAVDSVRLTSNGKGVISSDSPLPQGQYLLRVGVGLDLELLIGEEQKNIRIQIPSANRKDCKLEGSKDTKLLWEYLAYLDKANSDMETLRGELTNEKAIGRRAKLFEQLKTVRLTTNAHIDGLAEKYEGLWFGKFIKSMKVHDLPYSQARNDDEKKANNDYLKVHFFDNIDLKDPRFWNTEILARWIDKYMDDVVDQTPDSLAAAANRLVQQTQGCEICYRNMLMRFVNNAINSNRMGMENVWAELAENYIFEKSIDWINKEELDKLASAYEKIKANRVGIRAHNLLLKDINGREFNTDDIKSDYLLVYFYSPTCPLCRLYLPRLYHDVYLKYKDIFEVVAMNVDNDEDFWKGFVSENEMTGWINSHDPQFKSEYWLYFNTDIIPASFLLNKDKKIVARNLYIDDLEKYLEVKFNNNGNN